MTDAVLFNDQLTVGMGQKAACTVGNENQIFPVSPNGRIDVRLERRKVQFADNHPARFNGLCQINGGLARTHGNERSRNEGGFLLSGLGVVWLTGQVQSDVLVVEGRHEIQSAVQVEYVQGVKIAVGALRIGQKLFQVGAIGGFDGLPQCIEHAFGAVRIGDDRGWQCCATV